MNRFKLSKKQKHISKSFMRPESYILFDGGIRTGKTMFGEYAFVDWTLVNTLRPVINTIDDNTYIILAKTFSNIKDTLEKHLVERLRMRGIYPAVGGRGIMFMCNGVTVRYKYYSAKDKASKNLMQGFTSRGVFGDEAPLLDRDTLETAIGRTVTYTDAKYFLTSNPEGGQSHWYYQDYLCNKKLSRYIVHMTMYDNPILSPQKIEELSGAFTDSMYKQKVLGMWVVGEGSVFPNVPPMVDSQVNDYNWITIGLDEGRKDATVLVAWGYIKETKQWHAFDCFYDKTANGDINILTSRIVEWLASISETYSCPKRLICETNPGIMKGLIQRHRGFRGLRIGIEYVSKKRDVTKFASTNAIKQRIDLLNLMCNTDRLVIHKKAIKYHNAMMNALYDSRGVRKDDGSSDIDTLDAGEYGLKPYLKFIMNEIYLELGLKGDND